MAEGILAFAFGALLGGTVIWMVLTAARRLSQEEGHLADREPPEEERTAA